MCVCMCVCQVVINALTEMKKGYVDKKLYSRVNDTFTERAERIFEEVIFEHRPE